MWDEQTMLPTDEPSMKGLREDLKKRQDLLRKAYRPDNEPKSRQVPVKGRWADVEDKLGGTADMTGVRLEKRTQWQA